MEIQGLQPYTDADTPADISNDDYQHRPTWLSAAERAVADAVENTGALPCSIRVHVSRDCEHGFQGIVSRDFRRS
jgi:hypothetical protein